MMACLQVICTWLRRPNHQNASNSGIRMAVITKVTAAAWLRPPDGTGVRPLQPKRDEV